MIYALGLLVGFFFATSAALGTNMNYNDYDSLFIKYANKYGLNWRMLKRIAWIESRVGTYKSVAHGILNPDDIEKSVSFDGLSWGIMQTTLATSRDYLPTVKAEDLNNPEISISIAAQHLNFLIKRYPQFNERDIVMAYNHGQGNQLKFIKAEKKGTLSDSSYLAGRDYYNKYLKAKEAVG